MEPLGKIVHILQVLLVASAGDDESQLDRPAALQPEAYWRYSIILEVSRASRSATNLAMGV